MPTGYTAGVVNGTILDFRTFALDCARAFGACVTMRDDPGGGEMIPEAFEPSTWDAQRAAEDRRRMAEIKAMTPAEADAAALAEYAEESERRAKVRAEWKAEDKRIDAMLALVEEWKPPTRDHDEMKKFMRQQLTISRNGDDHDFLDAPKLLSGRMWRMKEVARLIESIAASEKHQREENDRAVKRTAWIKALRASLPPSPGRGEERKEG